MPPGPNLELVDNGDNDFVINSPLPLENPTISDTQTDTQTSRRYPRSENRQRPARYRDDNVNI